VNHNRQRRHSALGMRALMEFELLHQHPTRGLKLGSATPGPWHIRISRHAGAVHRSMSGAVPDVIQIYLRVGRAGLEPATNELPDSHASKHRFIRDNACPTTDIGFSIVTGELTDSSSGSSASATLMPFRAKNAAREEYF